MRSEEFGRSSLWAVVQNRLSEAVVMNHQDVVKTAVPQIPGLDEETEGILFLAARVMGRRQVVLEQQGRIRLMVFLLQPEFPLPQRRMSAQLKAPVAEVAEELVRILAAVLQIVNALFFPVLVFIVIVLFPVRENSYPIIIK